MSKTRILKLDHDSPDESAIEFAAELLRDGGLVAFPTETVYGIGANFLNKETIKRLYEIKKRPLNKPFTVHISSIDTVTNMGCDIPPIGERLINKFWPGPLTIILKSRTGNKIGFRMPKNRIAKDIISKSKVPVVAPSANISGEKPPTGTEEILESLDGKIDLILDSGRTEFGAESTIVELTGDSYRVLREGAISKETVEEAAYKPE
ncbi:L-threonylcarbamoyladenylate synthase [Candidatus Omnitrophota bacterium]